jgi:hypothetical protein
VRAGKKAALTQLIQVFSDGLWTDFESFRQIVHADTAHLAGQFENGVMAFNKHEVSVR